MVLVWEEVRTDDRGYRELEHTADWELEVWAPDMPALLEQAAQGMYELMGVELETQPRTRRRVEAEGDDLEALLVSLLHELLYLTESEGIGFDGFSAEVEAGRVLVTADGAPIRSRAKEIKAVTFHRLEVRESERGLSTRVVFDV